MTEPYNDPYTQMEAREIDAMRRRCEELEKQVQRNYKAMTDAIDREMGTQSKCGSLQRHNARLKEALELYKQASYQSHSGHWDAQGTYGANCPECLRASALREHAQQAMQEEGGGG